MMNSRCSKAYVCQVPASAALACALAACSGGGSASAPGGAAGPAATATPLASPTTAASAQPQGAAKAPIEGLVAMGSESFLTTPGAVPDNGMEEIAAHPAVYRAAVINVTWAQLEPERGVFDDGAIASGLASIAAYNAKYPATPVEAKLRVFAGGHTPSWVYPIAGGPIAVDDDGTTVDIAAFWTPAYDTLWKELQDHLAATYDGTSSIAETTVGACSSITAEPFVTPLDATSLAALRAYGFDDAADRACLTNAMNDYASWKATPLDFPFNIYRDSDGPSLVEDPAFTQSVMAAWRGALGGRAILANHGLQNPLSASGQSVDDLIAPYGPPIEFQGISPTIDWDSAISLGLTYHPTEIEIWQTVAAGGPATISQTQLQAYAAELP